MNARQKLLLASCHPSVGLLLTSFTPGRLGVYLPHGSRISPENPHLFRCTHFSQTSLAKRCVGQCGSLFYVSLPLCGEFVRASPVRLSSRLARGT